MAFESTAGGVFDAAAALPAADLSRALRGAAGTARLLFRVRAVAIRMTGEDGTLVTVAGTEGVDSLAGGSAQVTVRSFPLRSGGVQTGTMDVYEAPSAAWPEERVTAIRAYANVVADLLWLGRERPRSRRRPAPPRLSGGSLPLLNMLSSEEQSVMLYEATLLSAEQDERTVLDRFAALVVPMFADWCVVFAAAPDGSLTRSAVAAADRDDLELLEHVRRRWPDPGPDHPAVEVARTGTPVLLRSITGDALARLASDTEHRRLLEDMGPRSILILPLEGASERLGAVAFVSTLTARYTDADLAFGTALAARLTNALIRARRRAR